MEDFHQTNLDSLSWTYMFLSLEHLSEPFTLSTWSQGLRTVYKVLEDNTWKAVHSHSQNAGDMLN